jgi:CRP-like cAMP-binding protein
MFGCTQYWLLHTTVMYHQLKDHLSTLIHFTEDEWRILKSCYTPQLVAKKDVLLQEGEVCRYVWFINKGCTRIFYINKEGEEITTDFLREGQFVTDFRSFITQAPATINIDALEPCELLAMSFEEREIVLKRVAEGEKLGRITAEQVFLKLFPRFEYFYLESPEDRYKRFIVEYPEIIQRVPLHYIASYLGIKAETLSRIRNRMMKS